MPFLSRNFLIEYFNLKDQEREIFHVALKVMEVTPFALFLRIARLIGMKIVYIEFKGHTMAKIKELSLMALLMLGASTAQATTLQAVTSFFWNQQDSTLVRGLK